METSVSTNHKLKKGSICLDGISYERLDSENNYKTSIYSPNYILWQSISSEYSGSLRQVLKNFHKQKKVYFEE